MPFEQCPVCGGEMIEKEVEKLVRGGDHTAVLKANAEVCLHCDERRYSQETVAQFDEIRTKLEQGDVADFVPVGQSFRATA